GIHFEISDAARITGNLIWNAGTRQNGPSLCVCTSGHAEVDHNTIYNAAGWAISLNNDGRAPVGSNYVHDNTLLMTHDYSWAVSFGPGTDGNGDHGAANGAWYPPPENGIGRFQWGAMQTPSLSVFNPTPGGGGNSFYLTDAQKDAVLTTAGIPH